MNTTNEKIIEVVNDLIVVNSERCTAYEKAVKQADDEDADIKQLFQNIAADSRKYLYELAGHIDPSGQELLKSIPVTNGKIYAVWANTKTNFRVKERQALLTSAEICERAIEKAYDEALKGELPEETKKVIEEQKNDLERNFNKIKNLHEMQQV